MLLWTYMLAFLPVLSNIMIERIRTSLHWNHKPIDQLYVIYVMSCAVEVGEIRNETTKCIEFRWLMSFLRVNYYPLQCEINCIRSNCERCWFLFSYTVLYVPPSHHNHQNEVWIYYVLKRYNISFQYSAHYIIFIIHSLSLQNNDRQDLGEIYMHKWIDCFNVWVYTKQYQISLHKICL